MCNVILFKKKLGRYVCYDFTAPSSNILPFSVNVTLYSEICYIYFCFLGQHLKNRPLISGELYVSLKFRPSYCYFCECFCLRNSNNFCSRYNMVLQSTGSLLRWPGSVGIIGKLGHLYVHSTHYTFHPTTFHLFPYPPLIPPSKLNIGI